MNYPLEWPASGMKIVRNFGTGPEYPIESVGIRVSSQIIERTDKKTQARVLNAELDHQISWMASNRGTRAMARDPEYYLRKPQTLDPTNQPDWLQVYTYAAFEKGAEA